jgi:preprotein translocase subunit SecD
MDAGPRSAKFGAVAGAATWRRRWPWVVGLVAVLVVLAGTGAAAVLLARWTADARAGGSGDRPASEVALEIPGDADLAATREVVERRFAVRWEGSAVSAQDGRRLTVTAPGSPDPGEVESLLVVGDLQVRRVVSTLPPEGADLPSPGGERPGARVSPSAASCPPPDAREVAAPPDLQLVACHDEGTRYVLDVAVLTGTDVEDARAEVDPAGGWSILVRFTDDGGERLAAVTTESVDAQLALVLGHRVLSAPTVSAPVTGGEVQISGAFPADEARTLAALVGSGPLPVVPTLVSVTPGSADGG